MLPPEDVSSKERKRLIREEMRVYDALGPNKEQREREQLLIDYMFSFAMRIYARDRIPDDREQLAEWMRSQLNSAGFETVPIGMSWAVLK